MAVISTAAIIGATAIAAAGTIAATTIASSGAKKAAETQAEAQQQAIAAQERAAEAERAERAEAARKEEEVRQVAIIKEEEVRQEAIARKEAAVKAIKYPTYLEIPEAQKLRQTLEERVAGRGLVAPITPLEAGKELAPLDISAATAPFAAQRRAGLKQTEALISAGASARGLGRSTIPVGQIGLASEAAERDIEERVAQLQIQNKTIEESNIERERQRLAQNKAIEESNIERERQQIGDAIARYEALTGREITTQEAKAIFERGGEFDIAETIAGKAGAIGAAERETAGAIGMAERANAEAYKQNQFAISQSIATKGASDAAYELKQAEIWSSAIMGLTKSAAQTSEDIIEAIEKEQNKRATVSAMVSRSGLPQTTL